MSFVAPILLLLVLGVIALIAWPFFYHHTHVGSAAAQQRRQQEVLRFLDGRPWAKVLASGTGWTMEQLLWLAGQYGYELAHIEGDGARPRYLVLRSTRAYAPFPSPPPRGVFPPPPGAPELGPASMELRRKAGNPGACYALAVVLGLPGAGSVVKAVVAAAHGESFGGWAVLGVVLLAGSASLCVAGRAVSRRLVG